METESLKLKGEGVRGGGGGGGENGGRGGETNQPGSLMRAIPLLYLISKQQNKNCHLQMIPVFLL